MDAGVTFPDESLETEPWTKTELTATVSGKATIEWVFDASAFKSDLAGKAKEAMPTILTGYPAISRADVVLRPFWKREFPQRKPPKARVWVIINKQLGTPPEHLLPTWPAVMERSLDLAIGASTINSLKGLALAIQVLQLRDGVDVELRRQLWDYVRRINAEGVTIDRKSVV